MASSWIIAGILVFFSVCCSISADPATVVTVSDVELAVLDDTGAPEFLTKLKAEEWQSVSVSANHLQKLKLSFELTTPSNTHFTPQQVFFRLQPLSTSNPHLYLVNPTKRGYELTLDFLGLVEELNYFSGQYSMELLVGDVAMANSFLWTLGTLDLDLPEATEGAKKPVKTEGDILARYAPKPEIAHIFRTPEKRPPPVLSNTFFVVTLVPFIGFLLGLRLLNVNQGNRPSSGLPLAAYLAFHFGLALILGLYVLFWVKYDLFTTLKVLSFLGIFTTVTGYLNLSHLADASHKIKVA